ncbi:adenylate kinase [Mollicutes bacterium LVI A0039]|nr:adenylate kinase [Mollicutes bacterium LVI A0039]
MISLIMGLPGAGKGTQADLIIEKYGIKHVSTGNIFRSAIAEKTALGTELASYMDQGNLVPDELTINILKEELSKDEYKVGFLLDGFPRTKVQAEYLNQMLIDMNLELDNIIYVNVAEEEIMGRLTGRLSCPNCGATYHAVNLPPKVENTCDKCSTQLITRSDDTVESVQNRLEVAKSQTMPVIEFYQESGKVIEIDASSKSVETVFNEITKSIG